MWLLCVKVWNKGQEMFEKVVSPGMETYRMFNKWDIHTIIFSTKKKAAKHNNHEAGSEVRKPPGSENSPQNQIT